MKKKILVIEDDHAIREIMGWFLQDEGYEVTAVSTESPGFFTSYKTDLILLNEWVYKVPGNRLCEEIRQIRRLQHVPVIILSTSPFIDRIVARCKADGFIPMPFDLEEVVIKVEKCFAPNQKTKAVLN